MKKGSKMPTWAFPIQEEFHGGSQTAEEFAWLRAVERFQREAEVRYPSPRQLLAILHRLGYRLTEPPDPAVQLKAWLMAHANPKDEPCDRSPPASLEHLAALAVPTAASSPARRSRPAATPRSWWP